HGGGRRSAARPPLTAPDLFCSAELPSPQAWRRPIVGATPYANPPRRPSITGPPRRSVPVVGGGELTEADEVHVLAETDLPPPIGRPRGGSWPRAGRCVSGVIKNPAEIRWSGT